MNAVVKAQNLALGYDTNLVLQDVSLEIPAGQMVAIMGPNGCGKSTFVKALVGINPVKAGRLEVIGADVTDKRKVNWEKIGYVPQRSTSGSAMHATALEIVSTGLLHRKRWHLGKKTELAKQALDKVGLLERAYDCVEDFSGGQQQRVLIARALISDPQLLILDEPLSAIDKESRQALATILASLKKAGHSIIVVLHHPGELKDLLDRAIFFSDGSLSADLDDEDCHCLETQTPGHHFYWGNAND